MKSLRSRTHISGHFPKQRLFLPHLPPKEYVVFGHRKKCFRKRTPDCRFLKTEVYRILVDGWKWRFLPEYDAIRARAKRVLCRCRHAQELFKWSLYLPYLAWESRFIYRTHPLGDCCKSQSKQSCLIVMGKMILFRGKNLFLKINLLGKWLTQGISGNKGFPWSLISSWGKLTFSNRSRTFPWTRRAALDVLTNEEKNLRFRKYLIRN